MPPSFEPFSVSALSLNSACVRLLPLAGGYATGKKKRERCSGIGALKSKYPCHSQVIDPSSFSSVYELWHRCWKTSRLVKMREPGAGRDCLEKETIELSQPQYSGEHCRLRDSMRVFQGGSTALTGFRLSFRVICPPSGTNHSREKRNLRPLVV